MFRDDGEYDKTSEFYKHGPIAVIMEWVPWSEASCAMYHDSRLDIL